MLTSKAAALCAIYITMLVLNSDFCVLFSSCVCVYTVFTQPHLYLFNLVFIQSGLFDKFFVLIGFFPPISFQTHLINPVLTLLPKERKAGISLTQRRTPPAGGKQTSITSFLTSQPGMMTCSGEYFIVQETRKEYDCVSMLEY